MSNNLLTEKSCFPLSLFSFREYNGLKILMLFLFILSNIYFVNGMSDLAHWENKWYRPDAPLKMIAFTYHVLVYVIVYCMTWLAFDLKNVIGYASGFFTLVVGIIYIISPADFVPDFVPGLGTFDDAIVGGGSIAFALQSFYKTSLRRNQIEMILSLSQNNDSEILEKILGLDGYKKTL